MRREIDGRITVSSGKTLRSFYLEMLSADLSHTALTGVRIIWMFLMNDSI